MSIVGVIICFSMTGLLTIDVRTGANAKSTVSRNPNPPVRNELRLLYQQNRKRKVKGQQRPDLTKMTTSTTRFQHFVSMLHVDFPLREPKHVFIQQRGPHKNPFTRLLVSSERKYDNPFTRGAMVAHSDARGPAFILRWSVTRG